MKSNKFFFWYYLFTSIFAQSTAPLDKIKQQDLKDDLYEGWRFRGRRGGELGEMRASVWVAQRPVKLVLSAGEDGTYFQFFNLKRSRVA
jgi:hypothetical protein